ncbi:BglG family transcription antiterminator [Cohnella nanjingensis]|uniref:BglG family transcription antiterminator n=1 Tax=Cohnella nanjingensis TaxID=1387779 RepID=A0A7X0RQR6_9BACL|nr:BglG family transcription antiterminator [Cohnella nanjingensis]MBB6671912.1 BglG family transcription antiterminator [Cohnella nanjingensis]
MIVSNRQRRLLEVLLKRQGEVTAGEIAEELQISTRTVHREIQELEPILHENRLSLVKKSGIGISIHGKEEDVARFKRLLGASVSANYSSEERKTLILCRLLEEAEPVKLYALAHTLHAAIPTIARDLDEMEPQLRKNGLELVRRRGYGVEIAGEESAKRSLIAMMAQTYLDESDLFGASPEAPSAGPVTAQLLRMAGKKHILDIEQLLWKIEEGWPNRLSDTAYTRLLIRLSVAFARMRAQHWIAPSEETGVQAGSPSPKLERFAQAFGIDWPDAEKAYVQRLIDEVKEAAPPPSATPLEMYGVTLAESAVDLIRAVGKRIDVSFDKDRSLLDGLVRHLGPALERLREGEAIRNPLLPQIRKDYAPLFAAVRSGTDEALRDIEVPDEEIGYLVMHFGAAMERWKMFPRSVRALLVCTSGIGSSKLLAVRINKEIPQIDLIGNYSWYEAARIPQDRYDLIVSTVDLPVEPGRYIKLSPLLTSEEAEKLRAYIRKLAAAPPPPAAGPKDEAGPLERLRRMSAYTSEIVQVLDPFEVYPLELGDRSRDLRAVLTAVLAEVSPKGNLENEERLVEQLIERERHGSQLITDTKLVLFHTRSEWVRKPVLSLFRLDPPLFLGAEGKDEVRQILLMLAPRQLDRPGLEVLSEISAMLLQPEMIRLLEEADADAIKAFISRELESFMRTLENGENEYEHLVQRKSEAERPSKG